MSSLVALTFDVERDCPPFTDETQGMEKGLPWIMDFLEDRGIRGTFFFTGKMASEFPSLAKRAAERHELGCHGLKHERLDRLSHRDVERRLSEALAILRGFGEVISFRAPNFQFPDVYYPILRELGIRVDSTKALHKGWRKGMTWIEGVLEIPAITTSLVTRLPWIVQVRFHKRFVRSLEIPIVYIFHPWEFTRMPKRLRPDCWFGTGGGARKHLEDLVSFHLGHGARFVTLREVYESYTKSSLSSS